MNDQKIERFKKHFIHGPLFFKGTTKEGEEGKEGQRNGQMVQKVLMDAVKYCITSK